MKRLTVVFMAVAAFGLMASTAAQAVTAQKATGTIRMGLGVQANDPKQAISFDVFETSPVKGNITYTNFGLEDEGSGVWVPSGSFDVQFSVNPSDAMVSSWERIEEIERSENAHLMTTHELDYETSVRMAPDAWYE